jgi:hypothetical protein
MPPFLNALTAELLEQVVQQRGHRWIELAAWGTSGCHQQQGAGINKRCGLSTGQLNQMLFAAVGDVQAPLADVSQATYCRLMWWDLQVGFGFRLRRSSIELLPGQEAVAAMKIGGLARVPQRPVPATPQPVLQHGGEADLQRLGRR